MPGDPESTGPSVNPETPQVAPDAQQPLGLQARTQNRIESALQRMNDVTGMGRSIIETIRNLLRRRNGEPGGLRGIVNRLGQRPGNESLQRLDLVTAEQAKPRLAALRVNGAAVTLDPGMRVDVNAAGAADLQSFLQRMDMAHRTGDWITRLERAANQLGAGLAAVPEWNQAMQQNAVRFVCDGLRVWAVRTDVQKSAFATGGQLFFLDGQPRIPGEGQALSVRTASGQEVQWSSTASGNEYVLGQGDGRRMVYERNSGGTTVEVGAAGSPRAVAFYGEGVSGARSVVVRVNTPGAVIPAGAAIDSQLINAGSQGTFLRRPDGRIIGPPRTLVAARRPNETAEQKRQAIDALVAQLASVPLEDATAYLASVFVGGTENEDVFGLHQRLPGALALRFQRGNDALVDAVREGRISCQQMAVLLARIASRQGKRAVALELYGDHAGCVFINPPNGGPPCKAVIADSLGVHDDIDAGTGATALEATENALRNTWDRAHGAPPGDVGVFDDGAGTVRMGREPYRTVAARLIGVAQNAPQPGQQRPGTSRRR